MENKELSGKELLDLILKNEKNGEITLMTINGLSKISIENLLNQPASGILYDLNRDKASIMSMAEGKSKRWINDYATACVIETLKVQNNVLLNKINEQIETIHNLKNELSDSSEENMCNKSSKVDITTKDIKQTSPITSMHGYRIDGISNDTIFQM